MDAVPSEALIQTCSNIGPAERKKRNRVGVIGSAATFLTAAALLETHAAWPWRLVVALPAMAAAMGFLQARAHLCVAFAQANIKVMGDSHRDRLNVTDEAERAAFRKKARTIYLQGAAATAVVVGLLLLLP